MTLIIIKKFFFPSRTHNDYSPTSTLSSSEGALIANPCPSNGDILNNENSEEPHVENSTSQDDILHCIERVQSRVDQLRHRKLRFAKGYGLSFLLTVSY